MNIEDIELDRLGEFLRNREYEEADTNRLFYEGDHLQPSKNYAGYIGIMPPRGSDEWRPTVEWLERIFASSNQIAAVVNRHVDGILGREPDWNLIRAQSVRDRQTDDQNEEDDTVAQQAIDALVDWWNDRDVIGNILKPCMAKCLTEKRAVIRAFVPPGYLEANGTLSRAENLRAGLDRLQFEILSVRDAGVFEDQDTRQKFGVYYYRPTDANEQAYYELCFVNDAGLTELIRVTDRGSILFEADPIDLNGNLYLYEVETDLLITEPVRSLQRSINYALTTMNKNLNVAGSRDTYLTNAQPPKKLIERKNDQGKVLERRTEDVPLEKGGSRANFLMGYPYYDQNGRIQNYTTPGVVTVDPVAVETFLLAAERYKLSLLDEVHQSHVVINESAAASGKSRIESRADFEKSLKDTNADLNGLGRWMVGFSLWFGSIVAGQGGRYKAYRVDFNGQVVPGADTEEEIASARTDVMEGFVSLETYLVRQGFEDPDAEIDRLAQSEWYQLKLMERRLTVAQLGVGILPQPAIAAIIEPDEKKRAVLLRQMKLENPATDPDPNNPEDPNNPDPDNPNPDVPEPPAS